MDRIWRPEFFNPATHRREFVISGLDYCAMLVVMALAAPLTSQAPGVSMRFIEFKPLPERHDIDLVMAPMAFMPGEVVDSGCSVSLFIDEFVAVVGNNHPLARARKVAPADIASAMRISFDSNSPQISREVRAALSIHDTHAPTLAVVQEFLPLPLLAVLTGALAIVPRRLIEIIGATLPLQILEGAVPQRRVEMGLGWNARRDGDADHRWFRNLLAEHLCDERFRG